ncbi:cytidine deaminase [Ferrimonas pelagia]|uniref:Cytidine deaminase n=1 Tax=Ferrimonas pelagia TaxID=1177826 RepID=A0ABP9EKU4_9GAMM
MKIDTQSLIADLPDTLAKWFAQRLRRPFVGQLSADERVQLEQHSGLSGEALALALLPMAATLSIAPVSHFKVGAIAIGRSGALYLGANLELQGQTLFHSVHGEQSAISNAWLAGETGLEAMVINASPCGHCRQFMNELQYADQLKVVLPEQGSQSLSHYLPYAFGPTDLGIDTGLMATQQHQLTCAHTDPVIQLALQHANASYAPYSGSPSAVVLQTDAGQCFAGRYAENAAFNPSLPPMQMALSAMALAQIPFSAIRRAVLLQSAQGQIDQRHSAAGALATVSDIGLETILVE